MLQLCECSNMSVTVELQRRLILYLYTVRKRVLTTDVFSNSKMNVFQKITCFDKKTLKIVHV